MRALLSNPYVAAIRQRFSYFATTGSASVLTFARGLVVASFMQVTDFGTYVTLVAIGVFSSNLVSFGKIEGFMKSLPRHWAAGNDREVRRQCGQASLLILRRSLLLGLPVATVLQLYAQVGLESLLVVAFVVANAWYSIYSAGIRATASINLLGRANLLRTFSAIVIVPLGGTLLGWQGAMLGEMASTLLAAAILRSWLSRVHSERDGTSEVPISDSTERGGLEIYFGLLLVAAPLYFDRLFVGQMYGATIAGTYAFLMIFQMLNSTLVGIVVQSIGPDLVRLELAGGSLRQQFRKVVLWSIFCIGTSSAAVAILTFGVFVWPLDHMADKYGIDLRMVVAISTLSFFRVSEFVDWILISRNDERAMLIASAGFFVIMLVAGALTVSFRLDFLTFIWLTLAARAFQMLSQFILLIASQRRSATP